MIHHSTAKLIKISNALLTQTKQGRLTWVPTNKLDNFEVSFPDYSVRISNKKGGPLLPHFGQFEVEIYNNEGRVIETGTSDEMKKEAIPEASHIEEVLSELHDLARRQALGTDKALDDLLSRLNSA